MLQPRGQTQAAQPIDFSADPNQGADCYLPLPSANPPAASPSTNRLDGVAMAQVYPIAIPIAAVIAGL